VLTKIGMIDFFDTKKEPVFKVKNMRELEIEQKED
jgi:hypothetical protein